MKLLKFKALYHNGTWISPGYALLDDQGKLLELRSTKADDDPVEEELGGLALPGMINAHSHAFQYAMAGTAEGNSGNDFWDWRDRMYRLSAVLSPDDMEAIARMVYLEMLKQGFTHVVEFHYIHLDQKGRPYRDAAELGARMMEAAGYCGLSITLVPVYYRMGGFGVQAGPGQKRFIMPSVDAYFRLLEAYEKHVSPGFRRNLGWGMHSLRAVSQKDAVEIANQLPEDAVFHIHVAEQIKEVDDCIAFYGCRPVEWLLRHVALDQRYFLVHATHTTAEESKRLAQSGASVILCPSTEGNLGDGLFDMPAFSGAGGRWCIGTDSHIGLDPYEELRWLDYGQRLRAQKRKIRYSDTPGETASHLWDEALSTGRRAAGISGHRGFQIGNSFDAHLLDENLPLIRASSFRYYLPSALYTSHTNRARATLVAGKVVVDSGRHLRDKVIVEGFHRVIDALALRI